MNKHRNQLTFVAYIKLDLKELLFNAAICAINIRNTRGSHSIFHIHWIDINLLVLCVCVCVCVCVFRNLSALLKTTSSLV